ncbi:hypothetical protein FJ938_05625 [Mesorhizobium sp. B2-4-14]|uniref:hypothetical protein n=1 Tax=Mesorhizobium sp. B2-4-14 TaxID=2589935 RepID=UPI00112DB99F|nr:hypothetical protein [Mesorhizobium sp. B2-4-14]TPL10186.1 hypothetical protein FJ938_05625 [Mesorhizobium sp. B2-4-14]
MRLQDQRVQMREKQRGFYHQPLYWSPPGNALVGSVADELDFSQVISGANGGAIQRHGKASLGREISVDERFFIYSGGGSSINRSNTKDDPPPFLPLTIWPCIRLASPHMQRSTQEP